MSIRLTREIRFSVLPGSGGQSPGDAISNSWGGWPAAVQVSPYLTLRATVRGQIDPHTGFVCNVRDIEKVLRDVAVPLTGRLADSSAGALYGEVLVGAIWEALVVRWPRGTELLGLELGTTPFLRFERKREAPTMVYMTQSFEFSASHRLGNPDFSVEQNRAVFGKCNNPSGHGHNYVVDVTIKGRPDHSGRVISVTDFEQIVEQRVIERFDHRHLNSDCAEFAKLNPTVENITRVIWDLLEGRLAPARLHRVRVWETPKTHAEYFGPMAGGDPYRADSAAAPSRP